MPSETPSNSTGNVDEPFFPSNSKPSGKKVIAAFDGGRLSSDAGVLLLREVERKLGIAARLAACLRDARDPMRIDHTVAGMVTLTMGANDKTPAREGAGVAEAFRRSVKVVAGARYQRYLQLIVARL